MNSTKALLANQASVLILAAAGLFVPGWFASAQDVQHLSITQPGGMPGMPVITGIARATNGVSVTWDGPSGYYQLFQKPGLTDPNWHPVGGLNASRKATITTLSSNAFFRVSGPAPQYAGAAVCLECHENIHTTESNTRHAGAFTNALFVARGGQTNGSCLPCHTVGFGLPTGFQLVNNTTPTPHLAGVQCESCHGPAANHAANPEDFVARPRVDVAATVCGGCHNAQFIPAKVVNSHLPYYEDWNASEHRAVLPELQADFTSATGPTFYIPTCGRCHSGTVREAHLENRLLPNGQEAGAIGIACATCHDPHEQFVRTNTLTGVVTNVYRGYVITNDQLGVLYTNQLRNPLASLQDYHASGSFTTNYNANINICGQCHNDRGASTNDVSRPPHHSVQYNMLLGTVGVLPPGTSTNQIATHALFEKQCVFCHMQTAQHQDGPPEVPALSGHKFAVESYQACTKCHGTNVNNIARFVSTIQSIVISNWDFSILQVKASLDQWATTKAPDALRTNYGALSWEYTTPGELSNGIRGPNSGEQTNLIPANIRMARFNLYLVLYDGSFGVHNGPYSISLLTAARDWVSEELNK